MKFKIDRNHFTNGLAQVLNVVSSKATMPILANVLIEAGDGFISLTTTNLDLGIRCRVKAEVKEKGAVTLPVRRLAGIVRELPEVAVTVHGDARHQVNITSGSATFRISGISKDEFPPLPTIEDRSPVEFPQGDIATMLRSISYAQSADETRYVLNGVFFKLADGKLTLVATDGRRLATVTKDATFLPAQSGSIILPAKAVAEIRRLLGKGAAVAVRLTEQRAIFEIGAEGDDNGLIQTIHLYSKVVEGNYPNYSQVVPKGNHNRAMIGRELFQQAVYRAALVCSEKSNSVKLKFGPNTLDITAQSPDFGEAHETLQVNYSGPAAQIAFNPNFLLDPMEALAADEIAFEFKDEASAGVVKSGDNFLCVLMPIRLS